MDLRAIVQKVYDSLEKDDVGNAVSHSLRLARGLRDHVYAAIFYRESSSDGRHLVPTLDFDWDDLTEEAKKYVIERSLSHWAETRKIDLGIKNHKAQERNILCIAAGQLDFEIAQCERSIADMATPPGMVAFDIAAHADQTLPLKGAYRARICAIQVVKQRIKTQCLNYAIRIERQLDIQERSENVVQEIQRDVHNYFRDRSEDVAGKLEKAVQLMASTNPEDQSLLLAAVRRAIKAVADFFYPAKLGMTICSDGQSRDLSEERYLNRLEEYLRSTFPNSSSSDLLRAEAQHLGVFLRRLNDLASKGVHTEVSTQEAKQGVLGLYLFLYNVISKLQRKRSEQPALSPDSNR